MYPEGEKKMQLTDKEGKKIIPASNMSSQYSVLDANASVFTKFKEKGSAINTCGPYMEINIQIFSLTKNTDHLLT